MSHVHTEAGAPPVRASDAERDQAAEILRAGYADGRLTRAELDERLAAAFAAKTRAGLRGLTSDLPGAPSAPVTGDGPPPASPPIPYPGPEPAAGTGLNMCLLICLLIACPPAGIAYWILNAPRSPVGHAAVIISPAPSATACTPAVPSGAGLGDELDHAASGSPSSSYSPDRWPLTTLRRLPAASASPRR